jgi:rsbT antagonist protein RsbS
LSVLISRQGRYLIASVVADLSDSEVGAIRAELLARLGELRARGIIIDVAGLDVIDSFVARSLRSIALASKLRGAETVIVGIQPDVAIAMVQFDLDLSPIHAALDVDEAFSLLERWTEGNREDEE